MLLDLCLKEDTRSQTLSYLLKKAKQEEPAAPELPEAEDLHHAYAVFQEDPEGGAAGLCLGLRGELHLESGHFGQVCVAPGPDGQPAPAAALVHPRVAAHSSQTGGALHHPAHGPVPKPLIYTFSYLEPVCCSLTSSNCCFLTCIQISQEAG